MTNHTKKATCIRCKCNCLRWVLVTTVLIGLSGCRIWDMAAFQWKNENAKIAWQSEDKNVDKAFVDEAITRTVVPFTMLNDHILVNVTVNKTMPLTFVLDSGAAATVLTETNKTNALKLPTNKPIAIGGSGGGKTPTAYIVHDTHIQLGDFSISDLSVIYAPTSAMPFRSVDETYFDGVLGADFFNCCLVEINQDAKVLIITKPDDSSREHYGIEQWQEIAMTVKSNTPYFTTTLHDGKSSKTVKLMLDTGSTGTLSLFAQNERFALPDKTFAATSTGIKGDSANLVGSLSHFSFGDVTFEHLPTYFRFEGSNSQDGSDGVLGNQVLKRFNTVFDFSEERMWYQPSKRFSSFIGADRSGLRLLPHSQGAIVLDVAKDTGAYAAKILVNSIITDFEGEPVTYANFDKLKMALSHPKRETVPLCWEFKNQKFCNEIQLDSRI
ncbi:retroviral-like aspartic protease family protein [Alteromonas sp. S005]|uniref:retroviral-like aspartic protease family protein n=1 Tax=Alteromonas sp. S005 TaxID=3117400 RepID=UPI002FDF91C0